MASSDTDDDIIISKCFQRSIDISHGNINQQLTRKQTIDQSQLSDRAINCRWTEMVSI